MLSRRRTLLRDLLLAALVGCLASVARAVAQPILGDAVPFVAAFPATVLAALLWGVLPGLVTAAVCVLAIAVPSIPPVIPDADMPIQFGSFFVAAGCMSILCGQLRGTITLGEPSRVHSASETPLSVWLKAVLWGAVVIPVTMFVAASWWSLDRTEAAAEASLTHASDLAFGHALRTFSIAEEIASRADRASRFSDDEVSAREYEIHQRLADMSAGLTAIVNANIWSAAGFPLARSDQFPIGAGIPISDRSYFHERRNATSPVGVSEVMIGRHSGKELVNVTRRRTGPDGTFGGIVSVAISPSFFRDYYQSLANDEPALVKFVLLRSDGAILAQWPGGGGARLENDSPLLKLMSEGTQSSRISARSAALKDTQLIALKRLPNVPVYVATTLSRTATLSNWSNFVGLLAAILGPITAGLVYVTWIALKKTRQEHRTSAELQGEIQARGVAERRVFEAQKFETLAAVTGGVAHDFNNLLAVVSSNLHVHKMLHPDMAGNKQVGAIERAVQSGVRLTRQLLSFSQKQALRPEVIDLRVWLQSADTLMRSTLGSRASWTASVDVDTMPVKVDVHELELALINVVLNAKHAMPSGGSLRVHISNDLDATPDSPMVIICVIDTGQGIDPSVLPKVFEPFFTTRQKGVGSGLGLSQVHNFCVQAGGSVSIRSAVGEGTTVCLHLPGVTEVPAVDSQEASSQIERFAARLLLVEDNEDVGRGTEQMLASSGASVIRVTSADAALAHLADSFDLPDVILSDISMPGSMNGIGLALEVKRLYPHLPVMLITGYTEQMSQGTAHGMQVFQKPVAPEQLFAELRRLVDSKSR